MAENTDRLEKAFDSLDADIDRLLAKYRALKQSNADLYAELVYLRDWIESGCDMDKLAMSGVHAALKKARDEQ